MASASCFRQGKEVNLLPQRRGNKAGFCSTGETKLVFAAPGEQSCFLQYRKEAVFTVTHKELGI